MKKKILLIISMFLFMTNVKALTFNVDLTNIEDKGSNSLGTITKIDVANKELDLLFEEVGDEVNFELTITNSGDRAGTLREIEFSSGNDKIEYTSNLPENGLAINGNDTNKVTINAKVLAGITKGKTTRNITITYKYDEGSCPEGEILSEDESMCLCPEGYERNENGKCVKPEKEETKCEDDEIYNETKKICEKKVIPTPDKKVVPTNPKTLDNIVLITLLFIVSGLGIYAAMFKKLKTDKKKITVGAITGTITLGLSFTVLAGVFGLDNLLGAIVNPITKSKEIIIKVNEEYDPVETWDGECSLEVSALTAENIFEGGSGTESDPYQIKTAEQLSCFAKSINNGITYEGQFVKQIKNIKLNDNLAEQAANDFSGAHVWTAAGNTSVYFDEDLWDHVLVTNNYFAGTYDGDDYKISGLYLTHASNGQYNDSWGNLYDDYKGLFGVTVNATIKNISLTDVYMDMDVSGSRMASLIGYSKGNLTLSNIKTYGYGSFSYSSGIINEVNGNIAGILTLQNIENNINLDYYSYYDNGGVVGKIINFSDSETPNIVLRNVINKGTINISNSSSSEFGGVVGYIYSGNILLDNVANEGDFIYVSGSKIGGVAGYISVNKAEIKNSYNSGDFSQPDTVTNSAFFTESGTFLGSMGSSNGFTIDNCYNSGNVSVNVEGVTNGGTRFAGIMGYHTGGRYTISNSYNTGDLQTNSIYVGGIVGECNNSSEAIITNCYNLGKISGFSGTGGIAASVGEVRNSYNKGSVTLYNGSGIGGITGSRVDLVTNSYNEGDIILPKGNTNGAVYAGGICSNHGHCSRVENSYNRGNIISSKSYYVGGIGNDVGTVINSYNSGNITFLGDDGFTHNEVGGILGSSGTVTNAYNLGDIVIHQNETVSAGDAKTYISGIASGGTVSNSVNKGDITLVMDAPYIRAHEISMLGITRYGQAQNCFNAGTISIGDSKLDHPVVEDNFDGNKHKIYLGEILSYHEAGSAWATSKNNKFNTNQNNYTLGCFYSLNNGLPFGSYYEGICTTANSDDAGSYTTEDAPDILSIINGDNAFNDELDEDGLPTLKVFNE